MIVPYIPPNITHDKVQKDMQTVVDTVNPSVNSAESAQSAAQAAVADDRKWAEQQAQKQMEFQERLSNTAYQRAIADMQKAGLNPALAYQQGGSSSPVGSMASTAATSQTAAITRENNLFKTLNAIIGGVFGLANTAVKVGGK